MVDISLRYGLVTSVTSLVAISLEDPEQPSIQSLKSVELGEIDGQIIQDRERDIKEIERSIMELKQISTDISSLVEEQSSYLDCIDEHICESVGVVERGSLELKAASSYQRRSFFRGVTNWMASWITPSNKQIEDEREEVGKKVQKKEDKSEEKEQKMDENKEVKKKEKVMNEVIRKQEFEGNWKWSEELETLMKSSGREEEWWRERREGETGRCVGDRDGDPIFGSCIQGYERGMGTVGERKLKNGLASSVFKNFLYLFYIIANISLLTSGIGKSFQFFPSSGGSLSSTNE